MTTTAPTPFRTSAVSATERRTGKTAQPHRLVLYDTKPEKVTITIVQQITERELSKKIEVVDWNRESEERDLGERRVGDVPEFIPLVIYLVWYFETKPESKPESKNLLDGIEKLFPKFPQQAGTH